MQRGYAFMLAEGPLSCTDVNLPEDNDTSTDYCNVGLDMVALLPQPVGKYLKSIIIHRG